MTLPNSIVVCHGASEYILARTLSARLRVPLEYYLKNNGHETIAMSSLPDVLSSYPFDSIKSLHKKCPALEYKRGGSMPNLNIITIMDVDGDGRSKNSYITGKMFRNCRWENMWSRL